MKTLRALKKEEDLERRIFQLFHLKTLIDILLLFHQLVKEMKEPPDSLSTLEFFPSLRFPGKRTNTQDTHLLSHLLKALDLESFKGEGKRTQQMPRVSKQEFSPLYPGQKELVEKILGLLHHAKEEGALILSSEELERKLAGNKRLLKKMLKEVGSSDLMEFLRIMRNLGLVMLFSLKGKYFVYARA
ncbi:MAG: hypothetical protein V2G33_05170 [bacterium JZ-2024 1]